MARSKGAAAAANMLGSLDKEENTQVQQYSKSTTTKGLQNGWIRASFIVNEDLYKKMKDYAYTERISIKDAMMEAMELLSDKIDKEYAASNKKLLASKK